MPKKEAEPKKDCFRIIHGDKRNRWAWKETSEVTTLSEIEKKYGDKVISIHRVWICN